MVRVRVKNFQSIKDAEVVVDGLTVITGPNNSGKTSFMRAVKGVFTNASPGPLVRRGEPFLSVEIEFVGGDRVLWEKGSEKPYGKGKNINRYVVNGVPISNVGRGVPPEVEALGVREIRASSDRIWPQIAPQFSGTLFLVDRPGSSIAEALADVERVGRLSDALRLSEKDRRTTTSELKVRRKDLAKAEVLVSSYEGLDGVTSQFEVISQRFQELGKNQTKVLIIERLNETLKSAYSRYSPLEKYAEVEAPDCGRAHKLGKVRSVVEDFKKRLEGCQNEVALLGSFEKVEPPEDTEASEIRVRLRSLKSLISRQTSCQAVVDAESKTLQDFISRYEESCSLVQDLLGGRGVCPVCDTVWEGCGHD